MFPITPCLGLGQLRQFVLWLVLLFHETNHKQPTQDLPDEDETEPLLHEGLHPHRQLRGDGLHPFRHPHPTQPQALSGYQGELKLECICIYICIYKIQILKRITLIFNSVISR